jgi:competence protein ComEA
MAIEPGPQSKPAFASRRRGLAVLAMTLSLGLLVATLGRPSERSGGIPELRIDPNTAPAGVLEALPRIGPAIGSRIVEARRDAPFRDLDDLDRRVRGVGPATIAGIRPYLRFDSSTTGDP